MKGWKYDRKQYCSKDCQWNNIRIKIGIDTIKKIEENVNKAEEMGREIWRKGYTKRLVASKFTKKKDQNMNDTTLSTNDFNSHQKFIMTFQHILVYK